MSDADFSPLGEIEFENAAALFEWCEVGRKVSSNAGLIVVQGAYDIHQALLTIPTVDGRSPGTRARRVARHARRCGELLHATQASFAKLPRAFLAEYQDVIGQSRQKGRKPFKMEGV
jgi:hypothetical protein